ncbi:MAG: ECF-type sigma factor [Planctomycetia bacterium]|nr:ECF-type sigma factor [Planctomycetia bacterium]
MLSGDASVTEVTEWLRKLEAGHDLAAQRLWDVFFERLVRLAQERMRTNDRRVADAEDVALSAFASFCRGVENQRFPELTDRQGLWRLLVSITIHKLLHLQRDQNRLKRGGGFRAVEAIEGDDHAAVDQLISREPTPEFAAQVAEQYDRWMRALNSEELTRLTEWKLEGFTNDEIAAKSGRTTRTIERKLNLIRKILVHELAKPL